MWSALSPKETNEPVPSTRSKHSAILVGHILYLLGGKNGNLALKDFWKYNLIDETWQQIHPIGDKIPPLQEHTTIHYNDKLYIFGGEVGFSSITETPLWSYDIKSNFWKKIHTQKGSVVPKGRRGHSALVYQDSMLIFGGYQDLRGSTNQLWTFHFDTETWHLLFENSSKKNLFNNSFPSPRHKHSAIIHYESMWIFGGMTDLTENSDLWRWNATNNTWVQYKTKFNPGSLHSHAACSLPEAMLIFGGERSGKINNELWRFKFDTETWERINTSNIKPQPCAESVALTISDFFTNHTKPNISYLSNKHNTFQNNHHTSSLDKITTYKSSMFNNIMTNNENCETEGTNLILKEISKLSSQLSLTKSKGNCTNFKSCDNSDNFNNDLNNRTVANSLMVKSKSAFVIDKKRTSFIPTIDEDDDSVTDFNSTIQRRQNLNQSRNFINNLGNNSFPREPISVPNFSTLTLPTPVLTPVEAARLVFLDSEDDISDFNEHIKISDTKENINRAQTNLNNSESYSSHLNYIGTMSSCKQRFSKKINNNQHHKCDLTSDYASNESMSGLLSASNYSIKQLVNGTKHDDRNGVSNWKSKKTKNCFGFSNPNYYGPEKRENTKELETKYTKCKHQQIAAAKMLNTPDSVLEYSLKRSNSNNFTDELIELKKFPNSDCKMKKSHTCKKISPPKSLELDNLNDRTTNYNRKIRSHSTSRLETNQSKLTRDDDEVFPNYFDLDTDYEDFLPSSYLHYIIVIGGKERNQMTIYEKPISMWKLKIF